MPGLILLFCTVAIVTAAKEESPKRDSILSSIDSGDVVNSFDEVKSNHADEIRSAFPVMDAFKGHTLLSADDLKEKREYDYGDEKTIDTAVRNALRKLHKKKELFHEAVVRANEESTPHKDAPPAKKNITARELVDQVVRDELRKHGHNEKETYGSDEESNESPNLAPPMSDEPEQDESFENKIHKKLAQISSLEDKLTNLVRDVKHYLRKKKSEDPSNENIGALQDNDDVDRILAYSAGEKQKRSKIPRSHVELIQKFRNNPQLIDKYIDDILDSKDQDTANGEQRDLLRKKETESALLRDAVPGGEINSIPLSRLEKESDDYDNMATDRGIARDALVESPFSMLDIKKTTGKKFRHDIT